MFDFLEQDLNTTWCWQTGYEELKQLFAYFDAVPEGMQKEHGTAVTTPGSG